MNCIGPGRVELYAKTARKLEKIWDWRGGRDSDDIDSAIDSLKRELPRLNRRPPEINSTPVSGDAVVHVLVETSGLAAPLMRSLDQLDRILSADGIEPASVRILNSSVKPNQDITRIAATTSLGRRCTLAVNQIGQSPAWASFAAEPLEPGQTFVFYVRDDIDLNFVSCASLLRAYSALPCDGLVQPTPYGGQGASFPDGRNFADISAAVKTSNKEIPALAACENAGLVWLTSVRFLSQFDRKKHSISGHEFHWPVARPPANQFVYYLDLRQAVSYPSDYQLFTSPYERWRVERALSDSLSIRAAETAATSVLIFLLPNGTPPHSTQDGSIRSLPLQTNLLARDFELSS